MTKDDLAQAMLDKGHGDNKAGAKRLVDDFLDAMKDALIAGTEVRLGGFGNIKVAKRNAREGRNPHTGEKIKIAAKVVTKFKAAKHLADAVDNKALLKKLK